MDINSNAASVVDVLLLCALKDEYDGVLSVTDGMISDGWKEVTNSRGRIVADGVFATGDGKELRIRTSYAGHMGREQALSIASGIIEETPAKCIAMSGICAGRRGDVELGDVIFSDRMWSYDAGKFVIEDGKEAFQGDMLQFNPSEVWVQHMQSLRPAPDAVWLKGRPVLTLEYQENWVLDKLLAKNIPSAEPDFATECPDWTAVIKRLENREFVQRDSFELTAEGEKHIAQIKRYHPNALPSSPEFNIHVAPIATGAAVKEDPEIFQKLASSMRKVRGLDMEASGLAALASARETPVVVAKAVSDFGDTFKDDRYRAFAARASAECVILLLRQASHLYMQDADTMEPPANPVPAQGATNIIKGNNTGQAFMGNGVVNVIFGNSSPDRN